LIGQGDTAADRERRAFNDATRGNIDINIIGGTPEQTRRMQEEAQNVASSPTTAIGNDPHPVNEFSIWITKANGDIALYLFQGALQWLGSHAVKGGFATERGGKKRQLHLQGFALVHCPATSAGCEAIKASIKENFPIPPRVGYRVDVKPFEGTQTPVWMLGYIMKDNSEAWWSMGIMRYSEADCRAGLKLHSTYHTGRFEERRQDPFAQEGLATSDIFVLFQPSPPPVVKRTANYSVYAPFWSLPSCDDMAHSNS
jgi:hypothetical protein